MTETSGVFSHTDHETSIRNHRGNCHVKARIQVMKKMLSWIKLQRLCWMMLGWLGMLALIPSIWAEQRSNLVPKYGLFEAEFEAALNYNNPYLDVSFTASVHGPNGITYHVEGYWYEGKRFRLRIMPTALGVWAYFTQSNDPGLDSLFGEFECVPSDRPGILQVNPDYPYSFRLSEGTPFLWLGETNWCLMSNAVPFSNGTFQQYINRRRTQKFNGIHFVLGTGGLPTGTINPKNEGGNLWLSQSQQRINPEFYKWMDRRMAYLDSVHMAVGFFMTWSQHFATFTRDQFERWQRYVIARYAAYPLLYWVIVGEFDEVGTLEDYHYHGRVFANYDPYGHLITNHPNHHDLNNMGTSRIFAGQDWFGMVLQQLPRYPVTVTPDEVNRFIVTDRQYNIPVVNLEFGYEDRNYYGNMMTAEHIRKYAWAIMFGGGFLSYGHDKTIRTVDLGALESDGVRYLGYLYDFFEPLTWWELAPDSSHVDRGFCLSSPRPDYLVYLAENGPVQVDLSQENGLFMANWFDPMTGAYGDTLLFPAGQWMTFHPPFSHDAVLHIFPNTRPILEVTPEQLSFNGIEQGSNPAPQTIQVRNAGAGTMKWTAMKLANSPWLHLSPISGVGNADLWVTIELNGLAPGNYQDTIRFHADQAVNRSVDVQVTLRVDSMAFIRVISPNGGEYWEIGSQQEIRWSSQRVSDSVMVQFSSDNGIHWQLIGQWPNVGQHPWIVPDVSSAHCLIKVSSNGIAEDQSDSTFTIAVPLHPDFSAEPLSGYPPLYVTFRDQSAGLIDRWHWDFGDGTISTEQHPMHRYVTPGIFSVRLTIAGKTKEVSIIKSNYISVLERSVCNIQGSVIYFSHGQPVPGVALQLTYEDVHCWTTTDDFGKYLFEAVPHGTAHLQAIKKDKITNTITGFDALLVLRYLAALEKFSQDQEIAADVNRDRLISEADARSMLSYLCFDEERKTGTGSWRFLPDSCCMELRADTSLDWTGYVLGDVNGDWRQDQDKIFAHFKAEELNGTKQTQVKIGQISQNDQGRLMVPILVASVVAPLHTLVLTIEYPPAMLTFNSAQLGNFCRKFLLESNGKFDGKVHLAMAGVAGCKSEGEIIRLIFDFRNQSASINQTDFQITRALINDAPVIVVQKAWNEDRSSDDGTPRLAIHSEPNPFHVQTRIRFDLPQPTAVQLNIYNILGQRVRTLINRHCHAGWHEAIWDGTDDQGRPLNSGVYFYQLRIRDPKHHVSLIDKIFLLR